MVAMPVLETERDAVSSIGLDFRFLFSGFFFTLGRRLLSIERAVEVVEELEVEDEEELVVEV